MRFLIISAKVAARTTASARDFAAQEIGEIGNSVADGIGADR
jgi:hypothetical protein